MNELCLQWTEMVYREEKLSEEDEGEGEKVKVKDEKGFDYKSS